MSHREQLHQFDAAVASVRAKIQSGELDCNTILKVHADGFDLSCAGVRHRETVPLEAVVLDGDGQIKPINEATLGAE